MARKKRGKQKEEEAGEAWLLPYSDLMTLLLALFISLFAISQTDQKKVSDLAQAFSSAFNMGGPSMFDKMGPNPGRRAEMPSDEDLGNSAYIQENQSLEQAKREMDEYIDQNQLTDQLSTELTEDGLLIRIKEKALFPSGSAELGGQAQNIGPVVAGLLASIPERVVISGHTDNVPIHNGRFEDNNVLSMYRALSVADYLREVTSINPAHIKSSGRGDYVPIADNATAEGRALNRRVVIKIYNSYNSDEE